MSARRHSPRSQPPRARAAEGGPSPAPAAPAPDPTRPVPLAPEDVYLFNEGTHRQLWRLLGAHPLREPGRTAVRFAVWAPNAERVSVMGPFNGWSKDAHRLAPLESSGIWHGTFDEPVHGDAYKFHVVSRHGGYAVDKRDPLALHGEAPPATAARVWDLAYDWNDADWLRARARRNALDAPLSVYELHLGSWRLHGLDGGLSYRSIAAPLAEYVTRLGFTHVELLPLAEHPFFGSWGYQTVSYFAPSARWGAPQDLMHLVDVLHQHGIGVILDWVPSHFPTDEHGLVFFDGTHLYEHADPRRGLHPDWHSAIFDYGRHEVRSFLVSSARFWLDVYHFDALRVDAVASMLYLDYSRPAGDWLPNEHGGRENLQALDFLRGLNTAVHAAHPDVLTIAEESTSWSGVTRPVAEGGLGFDLKWDMGWMHDTLRYFAREPIHRTFHHDELTFRSLYAYSERFLLPLSHDEVVHGKRSLLGRMPGDRWQRFANLRLLLAYLWTQSGKKLLFMGGELGAEREWNHDAELDWPSLDDPLHAGVQRLVADLGAALRARSALHELDFDPAGFTWLEADDRAASVYVYERADRAGNPVVVLLNCTPVPRHGYRVGVTRPGAWNELLNTDATVYGGSGQGNLGALEAAPVGTRGRPFSLSVVLPPLAAVLLAPAPVP